MKGKDIQTVPRYQPADYKGKTVSSDGVGWWSAP